MVLVTKFSWYGAIDSDRTYHVRVTEYNTIHEYSNTACFEVKKHRPITNTYRPTVDYYSEPLVKAGGSRECQEANSEHRYVQ